MTEPKCIHKVDCQHCGRFTGHSCDMDWDELVDKLRNAEHFIERQGYRRCDVAACNCGAWHHTNPPRFSELRDQAILPANAPDEFAGGV